MQHPPLSGEYLSNLCTLDFQGVKAIGKNIKRAEVLNLLFKRNLLEKVLNGSKTQTRRLSERKYKTGSIYSITCRRYEKAQAHIQILQAKEQRLGDITLDDVKAEGFQTLEEFQKAWRTINGEFNPDQTVTAYEFKLI